VARVYGYHKITESLPPALHISQPPEFEKLFKITNKIKNFLKHLGLNEVINYSMISIEMIEDWGLKPENHLRLKNTISNEIEYMRQTLLASIYKNLKENTGKNRGNNNFELKFFEIAKVYLPKKDDLPDEVYRLAVGVNTDYFDLKGIFESLLVELNINPEYVEKVNFVEKDGYFLGEIDLVDLIEKWQILPKYQPINPYAVIKLDKTFELSEKLTYKNISEKAKKSKLLKKIEVVSLFENKLTLRFYFSSSERNITEDEAKEELKLFS
jgi:phenylalanyl-tRNA synthetase beta chain